MNMKPTNEAVPANYEYPLGGGLHVKFNGSLGVTSNFAARVGNLGVTDESMTYIVSLSLSMPDRSDSEIVKYL